MYNILMITSLVAFALISQSQPIAQKFPHTLGGKIPFGEIKCVVDSVVLPEFWGGWGRNGGEKSTIITSFTYCLTGEKDFQSFPRSAWNDLADIQDLTYNPSKQKLIIRGGNGDGADGYVATWYFKNGELLRRVVESGHFPKNWREETTYTNTNPDQ